MDEQKILENIKQFAKKLPKFSDGRINYSDSNIAPVITIFVKFKEKILILKRSDKIGTYKNKWNVVAGYLDELRPVKDKVLDEIKEELGINKNNISDIHFGIPYKFIDNEINRIWIIHPVLVKLKNKPSIRLNWEHNQYKWIKPEELESFDIVPKLNESLRRILRYCKDEK